ncbi:MAG: glycine cleavage system protein GcvH [Dehalococcoidia bacterium]|nr:glycine cleavage system protein GcvH [Dehalococcoidia bacterium]
MNPTDYRYNKTHERVRLNGGVATVGISAHAAEQLGDVVFVEVPAVGTVLKQFERLGVVESVKAVSDLYSPVSGTVTQVNAALSETPEMVNQSPLDEGWMLKLTPSDLSELGGLLSISEYAETIGEKP